MRQRLGQHFLRTTRPARALAKALRIASGDYIIEVGPGKGALTRALLAECDANGKGKCEILGVEKDAALVKALRAELPRVEIQTGDIRDALKTLAASMPKRTYKLCGNIPYYLTGNLLRIVSELQQKPALCAFMVQEEVADRITAQPPHMNRLAAMVQFWSKPSIVTRVDKSEFSPPPKVDSAVILLETLPARTCQNELYYRMARMLFSQPRKTVFNNIRTQKDAKHHAESAVSVLRASGIDPSARPQNLSIGQIAALAESFPHL